MKNSQIITALKTLREEVTMGEVVENLILIEKVNKSLQAAERGDTLTHEGAKI